MAMRSLPLVPFKNSIDHIDASTTTTFPLDWLIGSWWPAPLFTSFSNFHSWRIPVSNRRRRRWKRGSQTEVGQLRLTQAHPCVWRSIGSVTPPSHRPVCSWKSKRWSNTLQTLRLFLGIYRNFRRKVLTAYRYSPCSLPIRPTYLELQHLVVM